MTVCIIPARGGSKRIPRKNIKEFCGKPIIAYPVEAAKKSGLFDKIIVSTEDAQIAEVAKSFGAEIPFVRPKELSCDFTGSGAVVEHAVSWLQNSGLHLKYSCTMYATSPFIQAPYLMEAFERLKASDDAVYAFSVSQLPCRIQRSFKITQNGRIEMFTPEFFGYRSQDLEEAFCDAGQFYFADIKREKEAKGQISFSNISIPIVLPRYLAQDIDTPEDWEMAEVMYKVLLEAKKIEGQDATKYPF